jgi:hypothetical protein
VTAFWEEAAIAAACGLVLFIVFSTEAAMRVGRLEGFQGPLRQLFGPTDTVGPTRRRVSAFGASVFAAFGQSVVLAVALYRGADLGLVSILLLGLEVVAAFAWVVLLAHWVRAS